MGKPRSWPRRFPAGLLLIAGALGVWVTAQEPQPEPPPRARDEAKPKTTLEQSRLLARELLKLNGTAIQILQQARQGNDPAQMRAAMDQALSLCIRMNRLAAAHLADLQAAGGEAPPAEEPPPEKPGEEPPAKPKPEK